MSLPDFGALRRNTQGGSDDKQEREQLEDWIEGPTGWWYAPSSSDPARDWDPFSTDPPPKGIYVAGASFGTPAEKRNYYDSIGWIRHGKSNQESDERGNADEAMHCVDETTEEGRLSD